MDTIAPNAWFREEETLHLEEVVKYQQLQGQMHAEIAERLKMFGTDIQAWTLDTRIAAMGLSSTQRLALVDMLKVLQERQTQAFDNFTPNLSAATFADRNADLLLEMVGAEELWRVFRVILGELEDPGLGPAVKAAVRVAGDCYAHCIRQARKWNAISSDKLREQPLVFLDAIDSPATANRNQTVQALGASIRRWRNLKLPLPIAILPLDYAPCLWTFCSLHHEVGHNIDQDLAIVPEIRSLLPDLLPADQEPHWRRWSGEILADAFGVVLGGAGFGVSLCTLSLLLGAATRYFSLDPNALHPPFPLRSLLAIEMLSQTGVAAHTQWAEMLHVIWSEMEKPPWIEAYAAKVADVAKLFLHTPLICLADHKLLDINPNLASDHQRTEELAKFLLSGKKSPRPVPSEDAGMHPRLVPCAAQLAVRNSIEPTAELLSNVHTFALEYMDLIPPIATLAPLAADGSKRKEYLLQLTRDLDFTRVA